MTSPRGLLTDIATAHKLTGAPGIWWYHRYALSAGVFTPGGSDVEQILDTMSIPASLAGLSVLDIGTIDGGFAFAAERRGASRVVATEFRDEPNLAFADVAAAIGSQVEYVRASVYELPDVLREKFDLVFFRGALYHLRHPLLGIDAVRAVTADRVVIETALSRRESGTEFHPGEYRGDASNWFIPSQQCVLDWFGSSGFHIALTAVWPQGEQDRGLFTAGVNPQAPAWNDAARR